MKTCCCAVAVIGLAVLLQAISGRGDADALRETLMECDRAFARAATARGIDGWMSYMAEDAVRITQLGSKAVAGHKAIRAVDAPLFANPDVRLQWEPADGGGFAGGGHGFTTGTYRVTRKDDQGAQTTLAEGNYVTWWRKAADGTWQVILDTGAPKPATP